MKKFICIVLNLVFLINSVYAANADEILSINTKIYPLNSRLKKNFFAREYRIKNLSNKTVLIKEIIAPSACESYEAVELSNALNDSGVGKWWLIMGPLGFLTFGFTWSLGIIGTPIIFLIDRSRKSKTNSEANQFNRVDEEATLLPSEEISARTLYKMSESPKMLRVKYQFEGDATIREFVEHN